MEIKFVIRGTIEVPTGSVVHGLHSSDDPRRITLPNGDWIKLWAAVEQNDLTDLTFTEQNKLGIEIYDEEFIIED
jgi:hypothetical protein